MAVVSAAFSLLPDLDHQDSIASRALGGWSHQVAQSASKLALRLASTTRDVRTRRHRAMRGISPTHRTFTHTLLASFLLTSFVLLGAASSQIFVGVLSGAGVLLLRPVLRLPWLLTGVLSVTLGVGAYLWFPPVLLVLAAGGGYVGSILADGCTKQGVPLFWPMTPGGGGWRARGECGCRGGGGDERHLGGSRHLRESDFGRTPFLVTLTESSCTMRNGSGGER
jgi:membrane-bound metal-dependent hydrolase YbcI (DUF457 family)